MQWTYLFALAWESVGKLSRYKKIAYYRIVDTTPVSTKRPRNTAKNNHNYSLVAQREITLKSN